MISLDQARLFVLRLALSRPLGRHINALVLFLVALFFRLVDGGRLVLGRAVDGVQDEWIGTGVDELMLSACWHDDQVAGLDILVLARDGGFARTGGEGEDLVDRVCLSRSISRRGGEMDGGITHFVSDVTAHGDGHENQLRVQPCPEHAAEIARL